MCRSALCSAALCLVIFGVAAAQDILTNTSISRLVKAGLSDEVVIGLIRSQPCNFQLGTSQILELKQNGVSDKIIVAMTTALGGMKDGAIPGKTAGKGVVLPDQTPILLVTDEELSSKNSKSGEKFKLTAAEEIAVNGAVLIAKGAPATGSILAASKKTTFTQNGKLEVSVDSIQATDGQRIRLKGIKSEGGGRVGIYRFGGNVEFPKGTVVNAVVDGDKEINPQTSAERSAQR